MSVSDLFHDLLSAEIASRAGPLRIRRELADDAPFRFALFCESRPDLELLPDAVRGALMRQQFLAQTAGYAAQFPGALNAILERGGRPVGRLVLVPLPGQLRIVDIAIASRCRREGTGGATLKALLEFASSKGLAIRLRVSTSNPDALRFYARLGFNGVCDDEANIELSWTP